MSEDLVFRSEHEPLEPKFRRRHRRDYPETHRVYARRIRPASARRRPRLLYLHGYMQPETFIEELALLSTMALMLDVEVIQMQPPYHGRRAPRGSRLSGELYWTGYGAQLRGAASDAARRADAARIPARRGRETGRDQRAQPGRRLGSLSLTCLERRFAFSAPLIAHMDLAALVADAPVLAGMRRDLRSFGWGKREFRAFVEGVGWYDLRPKLPPDRILLIAASDDLFFDPRVVRKMWMQWGKPEIRWYPTSHMTFITQLPESLRARRMFIDRQASR